MKRFLMRLLVIMMAAFVSLYLTSCGDDDVAEEDKVGSIYGIVTELGTAEPMKAVGVELYKGDNLLLKTVTFDDGHFEFNDLTPEQYKVNVVADGYDVASGNVIVEAARQARIDLQIKKLKTYMVVRTTEATIIGTKVTLNGEYTYEPGYVPSEVGIVYASYNNPQNGGELIKCKVDNVTKTFSATIENLEKGTYYFQAYATNKVGKAYGEVRSFQMAIVPVVTTLDPTNVLATTATLNGRIDAEGDPAYTERGFVYSKSYSVPTVDDPANATTKVRVSGRNKEFSANISSLEESVQYYVRAYATNADGTVYGEIKTIKYESPDYVIINNLMVQRKDVSNGDISHVDAEALCKNSRIGGYSDWRLPTIDEFRMLYSEKDKIPNLSKSTGYNYCLYWSSDTYRVTGYVYAYCFSFDYALVKKDQVVDHDFNKARAVRTIK